jgi:hypothetical protein
VTTRADAIASLVGLALIVIGVAQMHGPAAWIVAGVGIVGFAFMTPRRP